MMIRDEDDHDIIMIMMITIIVTPFASPALPNKR